MTLFSSCSRETHNFSIEMFKSLGFLLLVLIHAASSASVPEQTEARWNRHLDHFMLKVDEKMDESLQMNMPLMSHAMFLNGTKFEKGFLSAVGSLKQSIMKRMRSDFVELAQETKQTRQEKGPLSMDEKMAFSDKLHDKWDQSVENEVKSWTKQTFANWAHKVQDLWSGIEAKVKENLSKLKDFIQRHNPLRKNVYVVYLMNMN